jgi:cation diffusion facilitator family transporter
MAAQPKQKTALNDGRHLKLRLLAISLSFGIGALLLIVKFYAYRLTHSSAVLSDALESIINVVASAFALGSVILAAKPPDESHPYGHGKIEFFSAGFEGALIIVAALGIFKVGISGMLAPQPLPSLQAGLLLGLAASVVNLLLGIGLVKVGRKTDSLVLVADGQHLITDVYTSAGVLVGLWLVHLTGWYWLDGAVACLLGLNILVTGAKLVQQAFSGLMDAANPQLLERIAALIERHRKALWIDIHQLRAWKSGDYVHIDFHLILPRDLSLEKAHREAEALEALLMAEFGPQASVLVHMDPCREPECPVCRKTRCELRTAAAGPPVPWDPGDMTASGRPAERRPSPPTGGTGPEGDRGD